MNNATNLFVISAPSGAGKTSLLKKLINRNNKLRYSISYTTRTPRKNETHGQDYFFVSTNVFINSHKQRLSYLPLVSNLYFLVTKSRQKCTV